MDSVQQKAWDAYYNPIIEDFKVKGYKGKEIGKMEIQSLYEGLLAHHTIG